MIAPRLEVSLEKIYHNARTLVERLGARGIAVTGVSKATLGSVEIAKTLVRAGVKRVGDSRIENIETMRRAPMSDPMILIRSPMLSQARRVVHRADMSCNTELEVIQKLSGEAQRARVIHGVMLMVELGDIREGIMPNDLFDYVRETVRLPNIRFKGIGTNLACRSGVRPDENNMGILSGLADSIESQLGHRVEIVSGGNSANLQWALSGARVGRVNDLRLGEAILLGCEPLERNPIEGLYTDAITLHAEVIEVKKKPTRPSGRLAQNALGETLPIADRGVVSQSILAIGQQDIDPAGMKAPSGIHVMGASSDHLIVESTGFDLTIGTEIGFQLNYGALLRAMTSPFVAKVMKGTCITESKRSMMENEAVR